jgi:hypothetical protein
MIFPGFRATLGPTKAGGPGWRHTPEIPGHRDYQDNWLVLLIIKFFKGFY